MNRMRDSEVFENAKARTVGKLRPFTAAGSVEAAACVLLRDGSEFDFKTGETDRVAVMVSVEDCAVFHTHSNKLPPGSRDLASFLAQPSVRDSLVVGDGPIYRLQKPIGFVEGALASEEEIEFHQHRHWVEVAAEILEAGGNVDSTFAELHIAIEGTKRLATQFGVSFFQEESHHDND